MLNTTKHYFDKFDLHIVGFVTSGVYSIDEAQMADIARFADVGVVGLTVMVIRPK